MDNKRPLLSVVIANFNYARYLPEAIESLVSQDGFEECELIVIDGGSTDGSVDIIKKYLRKIAYWVSEPDKGQSEAFNKGFARSRGKYLTWLNADDILLPGALRKVLNAFKRHPKTEWFTGNFCRYTEDGKIIEVGWGPHWHPWFLQYKDSPLVIFGPTTFFSRSIYEQVGRIDESLHYIMDIDLWRRFMAAGIKQRRINCFCWGFRMHLSSKTAEYGDRLVDPAVRSKMNAEGEYMHAKIGYKFSRPLRFLSLLFRLIDLSIVRSLFYKLTLKNISQIGEVK